MTVPDVALVAFGAAIGWVNYYVGARRWRRKFEAEHRRIVAEQSSSEILLGILRTAEKVDAHLARRQRDLARQEANEAPPVTRPMLRGFVALFTLWLTALALFTLWVLGLLWVWEHLPLGWALIATLAVPAVVVVTVTSNTEVTR